MTNSADPDQLASSEADWSWSNCLQGQGISGFSSPRVHLDTPFIKYYDCVDHDQIAPAR